MSMALAAQVDPDPSVIEAVRAGDRAAFRALVSRHERWVRAIIYGILADADRVDDVAQQVWQALWTRIGDLRDVQQWRSWLYRLARNAALDAGRDQTRRRRLGETGLDRFGGEELAGPVPPDRSVQAEERRRLVLEAIAELPEIYREPFVLRHVEGWSYRRIGETMDLPEATVETRLVRARQILREALAGKV